MRLLATSHYWHAERASKSLPLPNKLTLIGNLLERSGFDGRNADVVSNGHLIDDLHSELAGRNWLLKSQRLVAKGRRNSRWRFARN